MKIGSGRHERRFSRLERNRFRGQDRLKGFARSGPVMDEERGFAQGSLGASGSNKRLKARLTPSRIVGSSPVRRLSSNRPFSSVVAETVAR